MANAPAKFIGGTFSGTGLERSIVDNPGQAHDHLGGSFSPVGFVARARNEYLGRKSVDGLLLAGFVAQDKDTPMSKPPSSRKRGNSAGKPKHLFGMAEGLPLDEYGASPIHSRGVLARHVSRTGSGTGSRFLPNGGTRSSVRNQRSFGDLFRGTERG